MKEQLRRRTPRLMVQTAVCAGKGLGDIVADVTHTTGLDKLATTYTNVTGKDCGCEARREALNQIDVPL